MLFLTKHAVVVTAIFQKIKKNKENLAARTSERAKMDRRRGDQKSC